MDKSYQHGAAKKGQLVHAPSICNELLLKFQCGFLAGARVGLPSHEVQKVLLVDVLIDVCAKSDGFEDSKAPFIKCTFNLT